MNENILVITKITGEWRVFVLGIIAFNFTIFFIFLFLPLRRAFELLGFFAYITAGTTFIPLPTPQWVMVYGERFNPVVITFVGGIGTSIACLTDYPLTAYMLRFKKIAGVKKTKAYQRSVRLFNKAPFISLLIAAFTPIPWEPFRILAAATRYNRLKYALSAFLGRTPRYFLLAKLQRDYLKIPTKFLLGSILLLLLILLVKRCLRKLKVSGDKL